MLAARTSAVDLDRAPTTSTRPLCSSANVIAGAVSGRSSTSTEMTSPGRVQGGDVEGWGAERCFPAAAWVHSLRRRRLSSTSWGVVVRGQGVVRLIGDLAVAEVVGEAGVGGEAQGYDQVLD